MPNSNLPNGGNRNPKPPNAGKGRPPGIPNKATMALKDMILGALADAGGQKYLSAQAKENPGAFLTLLGKIIPLAVTGENGGSLLQNLTVTYVRADPDSSTSEHSEESEPGD